MKITRFTTTVGLATEYHCLLERVVADGEDTRLIFSVGDKFFQLVLEQGEIVHLARKIEQSISKKVGVKCQ